ncbi:MAG: acyltransferase [Parasporobacterium sp.]|nr:acyltransferase [Parasporobacterium sp.]
MKSNKQFMILSAIGIIMVVDAHSYGTLEFLSAYLPYNSFFMPMFVFISGYFYRYSKDNSLWKYIVKKIRKLLVPAFIGIAVLYVIQLLLNLVGFIHYDRRPVWLVLMKFFVSGSPLDVMAPIWFVPALFAVCVGYAIIRRIFDTHWNEWIAFALMLAASVAIVYICQKGLIFRPVLLIYKFIFFLPFYEAGIIYRKHIEPCNHCILKTLKKLRLPICIVFTAVGCLLNVKYGYTGFNSLFDMNGFNAGGPFMPFITTFMGIFVWMNIADVLTGALGENKLINYISDNTFFIMASHMFFFSIYNYILVFINKITPLPGFDPVQAVSTSWYLYRPYKALLLFYFMFGMIGSVLCKKLIDKIWNSFRNRRMKTC